jgi:DNA topoisomerase-1
VWINPDPEGHIQATGRDARNRKQYIDHPAWHAWRGETKFHRMVQFATSLPRLRRRVRTDMGRRTLSDRLVLATAVRVLEETLMRVGNDEYARANGTYGLTTLRQKHIKNSGGISSFCFRGKQGKAFQASLSDRRACAILRRLEGLPGQHLFQYVDTEGNTRRIRSDEINAYIRDATGGDFTAKDFRTWSATILAARELLELGNEPLDSRQAIRSAVKRVAQRLGNTPTVCRQSYIHPRIIEGYVAGDLTRMASAAALDRASAPQSGLRPLEKLVLRFLARPRRQTARRRKNRVRPARHRKASTPSRVQRRAGS